MEAAAEIRQFLQRRVWVLEWEVEDAKRVADGEARERDRVAKDRQRLYEAFCQRGRDLEKAEKDRGELQEQMANVNRENAELKSSLNEYRRLAVQGMPGPYMPGPYMPGPYGPCLHPDVAIAGARLFARPDLVGFWTAALEAASRPAFQPRQRPAPKGRVRWERRSP